MTWSSSSPHDGKATLEYVVMVILKQPTDSPLSKALARGGIHTITDVLTLSQLACDALTYQDDCGIVKPLPIGPKNQLQVLKISAAYREVEGSPIVDWMMITKKDFNDFWSSRACMQATKRADDIAPATVSVMTSKSPSHMVSITTFESSPVTMPVATPKSSSSTVSITASKSTAPTMSVMTSESSLYMSSSDDTED